MGSYRGDKKAFGEKVKSFLRRATLTAAFMGAAGGTGYNYYGTQEDVTAKITVVEGDTIRTDKGNFVNRPTRMRFKDEEKTAALAEILQPGNTVKISAYGIRPKIGNFTRDDFSLYRNISHAMLFPPEPLPGAPIPAVMPPATVFASPPPDSVVPATFTPSEVMEDVMTPEACAPNSNLAQVSEKLPEISRSLAIMQNLPLTGQAVFDVLKNPAHEIKTCLFPVPRGSDSLNTYQNRKATIARGMPTTTAFHEYFHAAQDINGSKKSVFSLTVKDATVYFLLQEATAVAYEIASEQEAENRGQELYTPPAIVERFPDGSTITTSLTSPSTDPDNKAAFRTAYDEAWRNHEGTDAETREAKALEAGGKAVVSRLLEGANEEWNGTYITQTVQNVNANHTLFKSADYENRAGYTEKRRSVYLSQGAAGPKVNFIPDEYLGPDAAGYIEKCLKTLGFTFETASLAPQKKPASPTV